MSSNPPDQAEFDFWEFVCCAKCRMPFSLDNGSATVPFWLTECGHVICNSHLSPDQSCTQCGSRDIQLAPLQREMEAPMSEWFQSIPRALESVAFTAKFQQETMAMQVRYYRSRYQQVRQYVERMKREASELKLENDSLRRENEQYRLRSHRDNDQYSSDALNSNGKRRMVSVQQMEGSNRPMTGSSSRSIPTPLGPNRLTLLPGQQLPELSSNAQEQGAGGQFSTNAAQMQRPVSRSLEQYAYVPADNNRFHPPQLTHTQSAPRVFQRSHPHGKSPQESSNHAVHTQKDQSAPPPSSRFNPSLPLPNSGPSNVQTQRHSTMGPPATPQHVHPKRNQAGNRMQRPSNASFMPPPSRQQAGVPVNGMPNLQSSGSAAPQRFFSAARQASTSAVPPSRASDANMGTIGQRRPFIPLDPRQQNGFR